VVKDDKGFREYIGNLQPVDLFKSVKIDIDIYKPDYILLHTGIAFKTNPRLFISMFDLIKKYNTEIVCGLENRKLLETISPAPFDNNTEIKELEDLIFKKTNFLKRSGHNEQVADSGHDGYRFLTLRNLKLMHGNDEDFIFHMLEISRVNNDTINNLEEAIEASNMDRIYFLSHKLKSTIDLLSSSSELHRDIRSIETHSRHSDPFAVHAAFARFKPSYEKLMGEIASEIKRRKE